MNNVVSSRAPPHDTLCSKNNGWLETKLKAKIFALKVSRGQNISSLPLEWTYYSRVKISDFRLSRYLFCFVCLFVCLFVCSLAFHSMRCGM